MPEGPAFRKTAGGAFIETGNNRLKFSAGIHDPECFRTGYFFLVKQVIRIPDNEEPERFFGIIVDLGVQIFVRDRENPPGSARYFRQTVG